MEGTERPEEVPEITEQSLLGNVPPVNVASVNVADEPEVVENKTENKKNNNKKNKNTPILYNAVSEEIVYKNIQNLSPNNLYQGTTRIFQNNPNKNKTRFRHQRRKNKGRTTRKTRISK